MLAPSVGDTRTPPLASHSVLIDVLATGVLRDSPGTLYKDVFLGDIWDMVSVSHGW